MTTWKRACGSPANCVEVAHDGTHVLVRDSKNPDGPILSFDATEWGAFVAGVKAGKFDGPAKKARQAPLTRGAKWCSECFSDSHDYPDCGDAQ